MKSVFYSVSISLQFFHFFKHMNKGCVWLWSLEDMGFVCQRWDNLHLWCYWKRTNTIIVFFLLRAGWRPNNGVGSFLPINKKKMRQCPRLKKPKISAPKDLKMKLFTTGNTPIKLPVKRRHNIIISRCLAYFAVAFRVDICCTLNVNKCYYVHWLGAKFYEWNQWRRNLYSRKSDEAWASLFLSRYSNISKSYFPYRSLC